MPRLVFISDTHLRHQFAVPDGDIIVHAGDLTSHGDIYNNEVSQALKWFGSLPHAHKICIAGNHDFMFEKHPVEAAQCVPQNVIYLQDSEATVMGLRFYGSPYSPRFFNWAFNQNRGPISRARWAQIPEGLDVLITHGPPMGILDKTPDHVDRMGTHVGCKDLLERIQVVKPKVHVFGHIHDAYGLKVVGDTTYINASTCNERYQAVNKPIVLDL